MTKGKKGIISKRFTNEFVMKFIRIPAALTMIFTTITPASHAADLEIIDQLNNALESIQEGVDSIWPGDIDFTGMDIQLGIGAGFTPDYLGSNNYRLRAMPRYSIRYKNLWRLNGTKFSYNAIRVNGLLAGPILSYRFGRSESNNKALAGLGDVGGSFEVGVFAKYKYKSFIINADARQAAETNKGRIYRLTIGHGLYTNDSLKIGAGMRFKWLSAAAMQTQFGVTTAQSLTSEYDHKIYSPKSSFTEIAANIVASYKLSSTAKITSLLSYGRLIGDASNSPLTGGLLGSSNQLIFGTALMYSF